MRTPLLPRLAVALLVAAVAVLSPSAALAAMPKTVPAGITYGGLHITPSSGAGTDTPAFTADHACRAGTTVANVNTIDMASVEQTISKNVIGDATRAKGFGAAFIADMNTVQAAAGTPGTAESFLFMVDCRTGPGHGTYTDAAVVDFDAGGGWRVSGSQPASSAAGSSDGGLTVFVLVGIVVALIGAGAGLWYLMGRRRTKSTV
ncbi:hypothetical protein [Dactylosporangium sp. CA-139066]|uniref:hypothetical protein n=1 Tax=Dactylosporangium sp. CA-139066 TaxID=3239930 RepID=UPI003D92E9E9